MDEFIRGIDSYSYQSVISQVGSQKESSSMVEHIMRCPGISQHDGVVNTFRHFTLSVLTTLSCIYIWITPLGLPT